MEHWLDISTAVFILFICFGFFFFLYLILIMLAGFGLYRRLAVTMTGSPSGSLQPKTMVLGKEEEDPLKGRLSSGRHSLRSY